LKIVGRVLAGLLLLVAGLFWLAFFSPRPPLATDPASLAGDGGALNYCELPVLDGSGKRAADIPKGNTPDCNYGRFPLPILAECTEPLVEGAEDMRGLWIGVEGGLVGHVERVEQCGNRTVVTSHGVIHDSGDNSTGGFNTNDVSGLVSFVAGGKEYCTRSSASMVWRNGVLEFNVFGWGPVVVRRYLEGDEVLWDLPGSETTRMKRICKLPEEEKVWRSRGPRIKLF
jgi:hypothetical protein